ncbi:MAG: sugar ABC transporter permease [Anaerolineaceae bacterium]|nr:sugar ABC transporter permease [Anaerolineaceae bacterium]
MSINLGVIKKAAPHKKKFFLSSRKKREDALVAYVFISPFILFFIAIFLVPAINSLYLSFTRYPGYGQATWIGLQNYIATLKYPTFWKEIRNILFYWVAHLIPMMSIAFGLALLVNSKLIRGKNIFKPIIFMPQLVMTVTAGLIFQNFFGTQYGILNNLLGITVHWLDNADLARWTVVALIIWRATGWWVIIYLAGLTAINPEIIEAGVVDGGNAWQRLIYIIIPLMRNTFLFAAVIDAIGSFRIYTEVTVLLPGSVANISPELAPVLTLVTNNISNARFGVAAATGWLLFLMIAVVSWLQFRILREDNGD